jgi:transposase
LLHAIVHPANIQDRDGGILLLATLFGMYPFLQTLFADAGYQGRQFHSALKKILPHLRTQIVKRSDQAKGFVVLPKRWIVERTLAWLNRCRRLTKDWENLNRTALAFLRLASIRLMLRKLCNPHTLFRRKGAANTLGEISRGSGIYAAVNCLTFPAHELCFPPSFCLRLLISDLASRNSAVSKPSVNWS